MPLCIIGCKTSKNKPELNVCLFTDESESTEVNMDISDVETSETLALKVNVTAPTNQKYVV